MSDAPSTLLEAAAERSRVTLSTRIQRLRSNALVVVQAAIAAGLAWLFATKALGHPRPFFAPVSAIVALGISLGSRGRRAVELVAGVALGIGVADVLVTLIGTGTWQLTVVVAGAMVTALLVGAGPLLISQAATSAVLVVTLTPPGSGLSGARFLDSLTGGVVAVLINSLLPTNPVALVRRAAEPVLAELAGVLDDIAGALQARDHDRAQAALLRARDIDAFNDRFREALDVGRDTTIVAPPRRRARGHVALYANAQGQLDLAVRNVRVLARAARRAIELDDHVPERVLDALGEMATAVRCLGEQLEDPDHGTEARAHATRAAALATAALEDTANLSVSVIVGQVRSTAVDLLRGMGLALPAAQEAVRAARAEMIV